MRSLAQRIQKLGTPMVPLAAAAIAFVAGLWIAPAVASARTRTIRDTSRLHLVTGKGNALTEAGGASGDLPGTVRLSLTLRFSTRTAAARFTLNTKEGTLSGHASGHLRIGKGPYDSFAGSVQITGGSGSFRGAHGSGEMYGAIDRDNYAMSVQVTGKLRY